MAPVQEPRRYSLRTGDYACSDEAGNTVCQSQSDRLNFTCESLDPSAPNNWNCVDSRNQRQYRLFGLKEEVLGGRIEKASVPLFKQGSDVAIIQGLATTTGLGALTVACPLAGGALVTATACQDAPKVGLDDDPDEGVIEDLPNTSITMESVNDAVLYTDGVALLLSTTVSHQTPGEARGWIFSRYLSDGHMYVASIAANNPKTTKVEIPSTASLKDDFVAVNEYDANDEFLEASLVVHLGRNWTDTNGYEFNSNISTDIQQRIAIEPGYRIISMDLAKGETGANFLMVHVHGPENDKIQRYRVDRETGELSFQDETMETRLYRMTPLSVDPENNSALSLPGPDYFEITQEEDEKGGIGIGAQEFGGSTRSKMFEVALRNHLSLQKHLPVVGPYAVIAGTNGILWFYDTRFGVQHSVLQGFLIEDTPDHVLIVTGAPDHIYILTANAGINHVHIQGISTSDFHFNEAMVWSSKSLPLREPVPMDKTPVSLVVLGTEKKAYVTFEDGSVSTVEW